MVLMELFGWLTGFSMEHGSKGLRVWGSFFCFLLCVTEQSLKHSRRALPSERAQRLLLPALSLLNPSALIPAHGAKPRGWRDGSLLLEKT